MTIFTFWRGLEAGRRVLYFFLFACVLAVLGLGIYGYFTGNRLVFPLEKQAELFPAEAHLQPSTPLLTPIRIEANAYLVSERYGLGPMQFPLWATWVYLAGIGLALTFFWTILSTLKRTPYYIGVALGMLWLSSFNLDLLGIFADTERTLLIIALAVLGISSYLFQAFWSHVSFLLRFIIFAALVVGLSFALFHFSPLSADMTALHIVQYGTVASTYASLLFLVLIAYENLHGLLWFNTQAKQPQRRFGLGQFLAISLLYLGNLLLLYLWQSGILALDIVNLDALLIFLCSAIVGFWGLRQRQVQYSNFFTFEREAAPIYLILAFVTFLNLGYACLMANDPLVQAYHSAIVITHLAYGTVFLLYVLANFLPLIKQRLRVFKVVYEPRRLPFMMVYIAGTVLAFVMMVRGNFSTYRQSQAGYYNYLGDLYRQTEQEPLLAEQFYLESNLQSKVNARANFSLADLYHTSGMPTLEMQRLQEAISTTQNPDAYLRLANLYTGSSDLFEHLRVLREGLNHFPEEATLLNNLALQYGSTKFTDSAAFYLDAALAHSKEPEVIKSNQLSFLLRHQFRDQAKEFSERYQDESYGPLLTNRLAIAFLLQQKAPAQLPSVGQDSVLTPQTFAAFYLRNLHPGLPTDTSAVTKINRMMYQDDNQAFSEDLLLLKALLLQRNGKPIQARQLLENQAASSEGASGYYYDILGQWMLQAKLYPLAADFFQKAGQRGYRDAYLHAAVALALSGKVDQAAQLAIQPGIYPDAKQQYAATQLAFATQLTTEQALSAPDSLKVRFLQLRSGTAPVAELEKVAQQITTPALAPTAALPLVTRYIQENNLQAAQRLLDVHFPATFPKTSQKSAASVLQVELWRKANQWQNLQQQIGKLYFTPEDQGEKLYYQALLAQRNKQLKPATNSFNQLVQLAPWLEKGQLAAADFFVAQKQPLKAYNLLLEAAAYNPTSVELRKKYVRIALNQGFQEYALQGVAQLEGLMSPSEYGTFKKEIDTQIQAKTAQLEGWQ